MQKVIKMLKEIFRKLRFAKTIVFRQYFLLWLMSTYIAIRMLYKSMIQIDFEYWEMDLICVSSVGYFLLTIKVYSQLTKM